mmetsp:Transcript_65194/g.142043  ORF Transcript_65194/g.142043 Transcript_65194/m.142043 type:complete len:201 (+) Transcript_65194:463-1065(+)
MHHILGSCRADSCQATGENPSLVRALPPPLEVPKEVHVQIGPTVPPESIAHRDIIDVTATGRHRAQHFWPGIIDDADGVAQHATPADDATAARESGHFPIGGAHSLCTYWALHRLSVRPLPEKILPLLPQPGTGSKPNRVCEHSCAEYPGKEPHGKEETSHNLTKKYAEAGEEDIHNEEYDEHSSASERPVHKEHRHAML